jgi:archaellum component FlaC
MRRAIGGGDIHPDVKELLRQYEQIKQQINEVKDRNPEEVASMLEKIGEIRRQIKQPHEQAVKRGDGV